MATAKRANVETNEAPATDWAAIELDYRGNQKSVREIAREHGVSHTAVQKHAKAGGWDNAAPPPSSIWRSAVAKVASVVGGDPARSQQAIEASSGSAIAVPGTVDVPKPDDGGQTPPAAAAVVVPDMFAIVDPVATSTASPLNLATHGLDSVPSPIDTVSEKPQPTPASTPVASKQPDSGMFGVQFHHEARNVDEHVISDETIQESARMCRVRFVADSSLVIEEDDEGPWEARSGPDAAFQWRQLRSEPRILDSDTAPRETGPTPADGRWD